jgi:hypothetical protein
MSAVRPSLLRLFGQFKAVGSRHARDRFCEPRTRKTTLNNTQSRSFPYRGTTFDLRSNRA